MGTPVAETPPQGLDAYWLGVWRHALKVMQEQGSWRWEQRPLLDEYVFALIAAHEARLADLATVWDRHANRSLRLANALVLTPEAQAKLLVVDDDTEDAIPPGLDTAPISLDELAARRRAS